MYLLNLLYKLGHGLVTTAVVLLPLVGRPRLYAAPQPWILVALGMLSTALQPRYNSFARAPDPRDNGSTAQVIWTIYTLQLMAMLEGAYLRYPACLEWTALTKMACLGMAAGLALRSWAVWSLGPLFSWHLKAEQGQDMIQSGPYRWLRHPSYTGALLMLTASPCILHAWGTSLLTLLLLGAVYLRRMHIEERMLAQSLGQRYQDYTRHTYRLIPWIY